MNPPSKFDPDHFAAMPLIAILRDQRMADIGALVQALARGGFYAIEITMNSPAASEQISAAIEEAHFPLCIGAGTVTTLEELDQAISAGAQFIVTPVMVPEVIEACVDRGLPIFPGAFTPTEIFRAHQLGATMVKVFPAQHLGPKYFKDLKAPLSKVSLLATGGITPECIPAYTEAGAEGFGLGSPLLSPFHIACGDWEWVANRAAEFCAVWTAASSKS